MAKVTVHLHTLLQRQTPAGMVSRLELDLPPGGSLADLLAGLGQNIDLETTLVVVNGRTAEPFITLQEGDEIHLIPALSGGEA